MLLLFLSDFGVPEKEPKETIQQMPQAHFQ
jgi:hypothetical protein